MTRKRNFEEQMERLQEIVEALEKGDLALEKGVLLYKEGKTLAAACRDQLEQARLSVAVRDETGLSAFPGNGDAGEENEE